MTRLRAGVSFAMLSAVALAAGCSLITQAYDFSVGPQDAGASDANANDVVDAPIDPRVCKQCAERPELAHPPCAPENAADAGVDQLYFFAAQSIDFGAKRAAWSSTTYSAGLDVDCSDRPDGGLPVLCKPRDVTSTWTALPNGVDNALSTQVLAPLAESAQDAGGRDMSDVVTEWLGSGRGGLMIVVDGWNGTADDSSVAVRIAQLVSPSDGGAPSFTSDESWIAYASALSANGIPDSPAAAAAYVSGGKLVADFRATGLITFYFGSVGGAVLSIDLDRIVMTGAIAVDRLGPLTVSAQLGSGGQRSGVDVGVAELIFGCTSTRDQRDASASLLDNSLDLHPPTPDPNKATCNATSVGFVVAAPRVARVSGRVDVTKLDSCPRDAGAD